MGQNKTERLEEITEGVRYMILLDTKEEAQEMADKIWDIFLVKTKIIYDDKHYCVCFLEKPDTDIRDIFDKWFVSPDLSFEGIEEEIKKKTWG